MSIKAILTTLLLGSSSLAMAQPWHGGHQSQPASRERGHGPVVRGQSGNRGGFENRGRFENRGGFANRGGVERGRAEGGVRVAPARPFAGRTYDRGSGWVRPDRDRWDHAREEHERWERPRVYGYGSYYAPAPVYVTPPPAYVAPVTPFVNGAMSFSLGGVAGNYVELAANGGSTYVQQVLITYVDGTSQVVQVGQTLDAYNNPTLELPTDGMAVAQVTVYGQGHGVTAYVQ